jgi:hypothetical protein
MTKRDWGEWLEIRTHGAGTDEVYGSTSTSHAGLSFTSRKVMRRRARSAMPKNGMPKVGDK